MRKDSHKKEWFIEFYPNNEVFSKPKSELSLYLGIKEQEVFFSLLLNTDAVLIGGRF
ncbi:hypothetical protein [uncultured Salegentibacter sp.]|uniref:hypothetical protein n=1 Tax=uncultured Salegentibacter sp. TaxID=259320 RepID=UPI002596A4BF|nr:hypothetical protein [uncultured Salegentibacter sp.]